MPSQIYRRLPLSQTQTNAFRLCTSSSISETCLEMRTFQDQGPTDRNCRLRQPPSCPKSSGTTAYSPGIEPATRIRILGSWTSKAPKSRCTRCYRHHQCLSSHRQAGAATERPLLLSSLGVPLLPSDPVVSSKYNGTGRRVCSSCNGRREACGRSGP